MSETKWTPGPWDGSHIGGDDLPQLHIYGPDGKHIFHRERPTDEAEANARLNAAGPELYEALEQLTWIINRAALNNLVRGVQLGQTSWFVKASDRLTSAEAAMSKARGE